MRSILVAKTVDFCYGHRLLNYQGPCSNLHGHTGQVEVTLSSDKSIAPEERNLNALGILVDFTEVKQFVKSWIDEHWDHAMLLNSGDQETLAFVLAHNLKCYVMPGGSNPTSENMAYVIFQECSRRFGALEELGIFVSKVRIYEGPNSFAEYQRDEI